MSSHLLADVQDVCDRIAILYGGELKVLGGVKDLLESKGETQLVTSKLDPAVIEEVRAVLQKHGAELKNSSSPTASLEELFLRTVEESKARPVVGTLPAKLRRLISRGEIAARRSAPNFARRAFRILRPGIVLLFPVRILADRRAYCRRVFSVFLIVKGIGSRDDRDLKPSEITQRESDAHPSDVHPLGRWAVVLTVLSLMAMFVGLTGSWIADGRRGIRNFVGVVGRGLRDLVLIVPRRVFAIATLTARESIRRKALWVGAVFPGAVHVRGMVHR